MNINTFRFRESVTFKQIRGKSKDMGELLAVAMSRGSVSSGLSVRACGCSERRGGLSRSCPPRPLFWPLDTGHSAGTYGTSWTARLGTVLLDSTSWLPWLCGLLGTGITHGNRRRTRGIIMNLFYFVFIFFCLSFISMFQMEKDKPIQFLVQ